MNNVQTEKNDNRILRITKGLAISFIITLITILLFSVILTYSNISEDIIPITIIILTFISILIGTIISTRNVSKNGMINGGIIGRDICNFIVHNIKYNEYRIYFK